MNLSTLRPIDVVWSEEGVDFSLVFFRTRCVDFGKQ